MAANIKITKDLQEIVVSTIIKSSFWYDTVKGEMDDGYFTDPCCKIIYKAIDKYYGKYKSHPSIQDIVLFIEEVYQENFGVDVEEVKLSAIRMSQFPDSPEEFLRDKIGGFIHKIRINDSLYKFLEDIKRNPDEDPEKLYNDLVKSTEVHLLDEKIYTINGDNFVETQRIAQGGQDRPTVIRSSIPTINSMFTDGGYRACTVNMFVGAPASGKSMLLVNEGSYAAMQGFQVLHILIGDLLEYDGMVRYISCISNIPQIEVARMNERERSDLILAMNQQYNDVFNRIDILAYPSYSTTIDSILSTIRTAEKKLDRDYNMVVIDYPDNVIKDDSSLYTAGGEIYGELEKLSRALNAVIMVASQPSKAYWRTEIIPLEGAAESSRKQQAADFMLCIGLYNGDRACNFGSLYAPKNRRGTQGYIVRFRSDYSRAKIEEISPNDYNVMKSNWSDNS